MESAGGKKKTERKRVNYSGARNTDDYQSIFDELDQFYAMEKEKRNNMISKKKEKTFNLT